MRGLPPLTALRAFDAAARHLSFTRAAEELHVTPAAISNQIKALEDFYNIRLFRRLTRALVLTEAGQRALPPLRQGFESLAEAAHRLETLDRSGALTIGATPFFASKWLVPRLLRFYQAHPEIDLRITASTHNVDLAREDVDMGIRLGAGKYPGLHVTRLMDERVFPVCSPRLLEGPKALRTPADLRHHTLLHAEFVDPHFHAEFIEAWPGWPRWMKAAGVDDVDATRGPRFNQLGLPIQAAIEGQGVALASGVLVTDDLAAGRLVRPFDLAMDVELAYYVVSLESTADQPRIKAFRDWVVSEAATRPS